MKKQISGGWVIMISLFLLTKSVVAQENPLQLLNYKQRVDYVKNGRFPGAKTIFKDTLGNTLKGFNYLIPVIEGELYAGSDYYVNSSGQIVEIVVRKATAQDHVLIRKLFDLEEDQLRGTMEIYKVNCPDKKQLLTEVLKKDLDNRKDEQVLDAELDNQNEATVLSILEQCGTPTLQVLGPEGMKAIFTVLAHSRRKNQEKYFPLLQSFVKDGILKRGTLAPIIDRLKKAGGEKQVFGSQIVFSPRTGYEVFPIEDSEHVDERRAAEGLSSLESYIKLREEYYNAEIRN